MEELYCIVHGTVQGVMYRNYILRQAEHLSIKGTVKNMKDGTVEIIAQGKKLDLEHFLEHARHGSSAARVSEIDTEWRQPKEHFHSFEILP
jgi:acylphosphatase